MENIPFPSKGCRTPMRQCSAFGTLVKFGLPNAPVDCLTCGENTRT
jgi:hypothetical protein